MHARREGVVGGLALVDVVVGEERLLALADLLPSELVRAVSDDFVDVHIALRPRARLPDDQRELIIELTSKDLVTDSGDEVALLEGEYPELMVGIGCALLEVSEATHYVQRHGGRGTDLEVVARSLGLCAPELVGRHLDFA